MKLHAFKFGLACSISAIVLWVICSVFVAAMPCSSSKSAPLAAM